MVGNLEIHEVSLSYNKTIVDLSFDRHEVLVNSKLNHIALRFALVNMKFTGQEHSMST